MNARLVALGVLTVAVLGWTVAPVAAQRTPPAGTTSSGTAVSRGGDTNSGSSGGGNSSGATASPRTSDGNSGGNSGNARSSSSASAPPAPMSLPGERRASTRVALGAGAAVAPAGVPEQSRPRGTRPATGVAVQRQPGNTSGGAVYYSPGLDSYYYGYGYGYGYGYYPFYDPFWFPFQYYGDYGYGDYGYGDYGYGGYGYGHIRPDVENRFGSVRLKVKPRDAEIYVDGYYTGRVDDFDGALQHLDLEPGPHRIEIRASGYQSIIFEVRTIVGRSITYSGDMERVKK